MKTLYKLFALLMVVAVIASCAPTTTAPQPTAVVEQPTAVVEQPTAVVEQPTAVPVEEGLTCDKPIKIGLITDKTGALALYGEMIERSFLLGMEYMAGAPGTADNVFTVDKCQIQVLIRDDQSNPETTATVARELIDVENVDLLVGTTSSGATATLQQIALDNDKILIVAPAAANEITGANFNDHTFRVSRTNYHDAVNQCEYMASKYKKFVQIAPDYAFGWGGAQAFRDACTYFGGTFVADDIFAPADTTDFTPYMDQILNSGAEAWIVTWAGGGFIAMMQAAQDTGVMEKMTMGTAFINNSLMPVFFANAIGQTAGILYHYTAPQNPINDWLVAQEKARFSTVPDLFDADGMNAAILAVTALKKTKGDTSSAALIAAMEGLTFSGPKGDIYIRPEDHVAEQDMYIVKLTNVTDPDSKFFELVKTTRPEIPCLLPEALKDRCGDLPYGTLSAAAATAKPLTCEKPIKIGLITDKTGALALYGEMIERSFLLGLEYMAGKPGTVNNNFTIDNCQVNVVIKDDQSNPETTATVARELIDVENVDLLVGTTSSGATAALQQIALDNDKILIVAPAAANEITGANFNDHTFRVSRTNYHDAVNQCQYMATQYKTFVQIAPDYAFGWGGAQAFRDACTYYGGTFVADDIFAPATTTDFTPYMDQILASGAEAWIVTWAGGGFIAMMQAAQDTGVMAKMAMGTAFINNSLIPVFFSNAIGQTAGILYHYTAPKNKINSWLVQKEKDRYGTVPDLFDADGMNAAIAAITALRATGGDTSSAALIAAMEGMSFNGPKGNIYFRPQDHLAVQDMYIVKLTNVTDPDSKFFELVKTTRPEIPCLLPEALKDRCGDLPYGSLSGQ